MTYKTPYQLRCKHCQAFLPAVIIGGRLWIEDVMLEGAILVCRCGRRCTWWYERRESQAAVKAAKSTGAVEA
jgi:hypothetical protein